MDQPAHGMSKAEIEAYRRRWGAGPHLAADLAVVCVPWGEPDPTAELLLIRRAHAPYRGTFALPGGFVEAEEDLEQAARRELGEETGLSDLGSAWVEQLHTYGRPMRDPRARVISVVFLALVACNDMKAVRAGDDASEARFFRFRGPNVYDAAGNKMAMAFDHDLALQDLRDRLRLLASFSSAPLLLVAAPFTLDQARTAYEVLLERSLDRKQFEGWIVKQRWLQPGPEGYQMGARRPQWTSELSDPALGDRIVTASPGS